MASGSDLGSDERTQRSAGAPIALDAYRSIVFPNAMREMRRSAGFSKLLGLAAEIPEIPYIRLSKIERGEVFPRADELVRIAGRLGVSPADLLIDPDDPSFDMAAWAAHLLDPRVNRAEEVFAVKLGAALRLKRSGDPGLSAAVLDEEYGIPPVILSRIENAQKTLDRWNPGTVAALCRIFGVDGVAELRRVVADQYEAGELNSLLDRISTPQLRFAKTRAKVAELRRELSNTAAAGSGASQEARKVVQADGALRLVPVFGSALADGLIARTPTGAMVEAPRAAGPDAYGLRVLRPTLGPALPARATVVVDPARLPSAGGLAVVREGEGYRLLTVAVERSGAMVGYSENPDREVAIDRLDPSDVAAIISALFE